MGLPVATLSGMRVLDALADLLLGSQCPGCDVPRWGICPQCAEELDVQPAVVARPGLPPVVAANPYRPLMDRVIPRYKDDGALHLEGALARRLQAAVAALSPPSDAWVVPVPSRPGAVRARGFDHAARLASAVGRTTGLRSRRGLRRSSAGTDQQALGKASRKSNMHGSMRACMRGGRVVLVDDIITTGASLAEAVRALEFAGVDVVGAAVIANADRSAELLTKSAPCPQQPC